MVFAAPEGRPPPPGAASAAGGCAGPTWAYRGRLVKWIEQTLGWTVDVVQKPRRWLRVPEGAPIPFVPAFTVLRRRWVVENAPSLGPAVTGA